MTFHRFTWIFINVFQRFSHMFMDFYGIHWISVDFLQIFMDFWSMLGELGSKHWGNRLPGSGGTAGPAYQNGFLIKESENPFRQAWLGK